MVFIFISGFTFYDLWLVIIEYFCSAIPEMDCGSLFWVRISINVFECMSFDFLWLSIKLLLILLHAHFEEIRSEFLAALDCAGGLNYICRNKNTEESHERAWDVHGSVWKSIMDISDSIFLQSINGGGKPQ